MKEITEKLIEFRNRRGWAKYHTIKNLAESVNIEASELLKCFQWDQSPDYNAVQDEIADVAIYLLYLCREMEVDLQLLIERKMAKNALKYPERGKT